jgi:hypothetical protein
MAIGVPGFAMQPGAGIETALTSEEQPMDSQALSGIV